MDENKTFIDRQPVFFQLLSLIGLVILFSAFFAIAGMVLIKPLFGITGADTLFAKIQTDPNSIKNDPNAINALKLIQLLSSFGLVVPAIIFGLLKKMQGDYIKMRTMVKPVLVVLSILILIFSGPLINMLSDWNEGMKLPASMKGIENLMRTTEDADAKLTSLFLIMPKLFDFIFNLVVIGIAAAVAEEFLFRGALQQLLREGFKNAHVAIWVTAIIFSAIHFQFYGFVPRMVLGAVLGYLFYWSGSIWVPIVGHFTVNGGQVILDYLHQNGTIAYDIEGNGSVPVYIIVTSTILLAGLLYLAYRNRVPEPVEIITEPDSSITPTDTNQWQ